MERNGERSESREPETDGAADGLEELRARLERSEARVHELSRLLAEAYRDLERRPLVQRLGDGVWKLRVAVGSARSSRRPRA